MASRQYRLTTEANWQSMFGQALIALQNTSGSGRKLTLRSFEVEVNSIAGSSAVQSASAELFRCASASGEDMNYKAGRLDSATALPAGVVVRRGGGGNVYTSKLTKVALNRSGAAAGTQNTLNNTRSWGRLGGAYRSQRRGVAGTVEPYTVANGEALVLMPAVVGASMPVRIHAIASVNDKTVVWEYVTATVPGQSLFSIENTAGATVKLLSLGFQEVGTTDTPYLRLVPVGQIKTDDAADPSKQIQSKLLKMNSTYPDLTCLTAYTDVNFVPYGVPEKYIADGSAGTPKGFSYIHTKDFDGPCFRTFFPEMCREKPGGATQDMLGHGVSMRNMDIGVMKAGIVLNPGEAIALVASAETAVAVQAAYSGWPSLRFAMQIDDEPIFTPSVTFTGLPEGTEVRVRQGSYTLAQAQDVTGGSYTYVYDATDAPASAVFNLAGFVFEPINLTLSLSTNILPVTYIPDPSYAA